MSWSFVSSPNFVGIEYILDAFPLVSTEIEKERKGDSTHRIYEQQDTCIIIPLLAHFEALVCGRL